jgi:ABC-type transport system involved in multi-copper enzyme maturation permease subunit
MRVIYRVAVSVFRESVRDRVLYSLLVFAVLLIVASYLLGQLTAGQDLKIIKDLGLAAIATFGLFIAIFIGVGLVWKEVDRRSIYSLLSKPVRRHEFVLGKYAGLALTLVVNVGAMTVTFYSVLGYLAWLAEDVVESQAAAVLARALYYVLPNFAAFDVKAQVVHAVPVDLAYVGLTAAYGVTYVALLLAAAVVVFERRDFR